jgi:hypothetical protein
MITSLLLESCFGFPLGAFICYTIFFSTTAYVRHDPGCGYGCDHGCHSCRWHLSSSGYAFVHYHHHLLEGCNRALFSSVAGSGSDSCYQSLGSYVSEEDCDLANSSSDDNSCPRP